MSMVEFFIYVRAVVSIITTFNIYQSIFASLSKEGRKEKISTHELVNINNKGLAKLVDIRKSDDFNAGHIAGSINMPFSDFERRHHELPNKIFP